ncbi:MAG: spermidine synthase [Sphingomicrobium sp.]
MIPHELVGIAEVPGGPSLSLYRRGADYMICLERNELMSSRMSGSEIALATMTLERLGKPAAPRILVGDYGMGFTLRALLAKTSPSAEIVIAELVPAIIDWARGPMATLAAGCIDDPRVELRLADVGREIAEPGSAYDAILLDVDNGPDGLTRPANDGLYSARGLALAKTALRPGGILAIWSAAPDPQFSKRLSIAGFTVDEARVRARSNGKGPNHIIWFASPR